MARKKKPVITGSDPSYTSDFTEFNKLPTNKPDVLKQPKPKTVAKPTPQPKPQKTTPKRKPQTETRTEKTASNPVIDETKKNIGPKREITLIAAVKMDQHIKLEALENKGLPRKDVITLAGRRAIARFDPKPEFIRKPKADRRPMREGYKSTKRVDTALLEKLRNKHDPLRVSSEELNNKY